MEACDTLHRTLMRGREPKELGNEIRCNSIQLLLSRHGWRFKTHPVKIRFTDEEEDCSSHSATVRYTATTSHSQQFWFISTRAVFRLLLDLIAEKCRNNWVFTHRSGSCTACSTNYTVVSSVCFRFKERLNSAFLYAGGGFIQKLKSGQDASLLPSSYPSPLSLQYSLYFLHLNSDSCSLFAEITLLKIHIVTDHTESCYESP